jgi:hypothetical protein
MCRVPTRDDYVKDVQKRPKMYKRGLRCTTEAKDVQKRPKMYKRGQRCTKEAKVRNAPHPEFRQRCGPLSSTMRTPFHKLFNIAQRRSQHLACAPGPRLVAAPHVPRRRSTRKHEQCRAVGFSPLVALPCSGAGCTTRFVSVFQPPPSQCPTESHLPLLLCC